MSITMRKMFTLIEMMIVIVVLGILAAIVIPNVSDQKERAITSMIKSNIRILQTAVDDYSLHHDGDFPTEIQPTLDKPQYIDIERLYPDYIKSKPDLDKEKNQKYWIDSYGKVWGATVDSPSNLYQSNQYLEWKNDKDVVEYNIYDAGSTTVTSRANPDKISLKQSIATNRSADVVKIDHIADSNVLLSSVDKYGLESAPVGLTYEGYQDWFQPLIRKTGIFTFELTNAEMMYWDAFKTLEDKPEGTSITYKFATINEKGEYSAFVDDFYSLPPANGIKVRVEMKGSNGKLPSIYDMRVIFHFKYEQVIAMNPQSGVNLKEDGTAIDSLKPVTVRDSFTLPLNSSIVQVVHTDSYYESNAPSISYYYNSIPVQSLSGIPSGSVVTIERVYESGKDLYVQSPIVKIKENPVVLDPKTSTVDKEITTPEWTTVQTLNFFAQSGDGQSTKWTRMEKEDTQPENTRIIYRFSSSNNSGWDIPVADIAKTSESRALKVSAYLQVRTSMIGKATNPSIQSVKLFHSRDLSSGIETETNATSGPVIYRIEAEDNKYATIAQDMYAVANFITDANLSNGKGLFFSGNNGSSTAATRWSHQFEGNGFNIKFLSARGVELYIDGVLVKTLNYSSPTIYQHTGLAQGAHTVSLKVYYDKQGSFDYIDFMGENLTPTISKIAYKQLDSTNKEMVGNYNEIIANLGIKVRTSYYINKDGYVTISVKDSNGNLINTLASNEFKRGGTYGDYSVVWDGKASNGTFAPSGTYSIEIKASDIENKSQTAQSSTILLDSNMPKERIEAEDMTKASLYTGTTYTTAQVRNYTGASNGKVSYLLGSTWNSTIYAQWSTTFTGTGFDLKFLTAAGANVYIDGKIVQTISSPYLFSKRNLTNEKHTIMVRTYQHGSANIDYIDVYE